MRVIHDGATCQSVCNVCWGRQRLPYTFPSLTLILFSPEDSRLHVMRSRILAAEGDDAFAETILEFVCLYCRTVIEPQNGCAQRSAMPVQDRGGHSMTTYSDSRNPILRVRIAVERGLGH
jgi:hypothetical protein